MIHLDFESRSEVDIFKSGAWVYSIHPSTKILCYCFAHNGGEVFLATQKEIKKNRCPPSIKKYIDAGEIFVAHNSFFEYCIWHNILVKQFGWPVIPLEQWSCTAAKASAHALPKALARAAKALHLSNLKDEEGKRVMLKLSKPRRITRLNNDKWCNDPVEFQRLYEYCKNDVVVEREIDNSLPNLNSIERQVWLMDQRINLRGVEIDREAVKAALYLIGEYENECVEKLKKITNGYLDKVSRRQRTLDWIKTQGVEMGDFTKNTVSKTLQTRIPPAVAHVLSIRQELGKTSTAKYQAISNATSDNDPRIRDTLIYHGASTGRWSGKLVQLHNLPIGTIKDIATCIAIMKQRDLAMLKFLYPSVMSAISSCLRGMIISKPGYDLLVADYSAIEARVLLWHAKDEAGLNNYREGKDIYVDMAKDIYYKEEINKKERQLGKTAILGCGYGMGATKFHATCQAWGLDISEGLARKAVEAYRSRYKSVIDLWKRQERAAIRATETSEQVPSGRVKWARHGKFLYCRLPSGRCLAYYRPKIQEVITPWGETRRALTFMGVNSQTKAYERQSTYGGKLVENITQATARDIMAHAMLKCEEKGYRLVLSVHDEVIAEVPEGFGSMEEFIEILTAPHSWSTGCPIEAEGWRGKRYKK